MEAARLAKEAGRPVAVQWTRAEEFMWAYFRPAALIEVEAGLDANNSISAWDFTNYNSGASALDTPYRIPNTRARFIASDSPLRQGSYRVLAATANNFAREAFTDELAEAAGKDPLEFRLSHLDNDRIKDVLNAATEKFGWLERRKKRRPGTGIGLACGTEKNSVVAACCEVEVDRQTGAPRVIEVVQAFECGAILNPANLRSQVEGCIMMGLGPALREEILFKDGRLDQRGIRHVPRAAVPGLAQAGRHPAGPQGPRTGGRGRNAHHRHRSGHRQRRIRRHGQAGARHAHPRAAGLTQTRASRSSRSRAIVERRTAWAMRRHCALPLAAHSLKI